MSSLSRVARTVRLMSIVLLTVTTAVASSEKADGPAVVSGKVKEADLNTITLTPEAEKRLGLTYAAVERRTIAQTRTLGGEVIVPNGSGAAARYSETSSMTASELATAQVAADGAMARARVARDAARVRYERAKKLFETKFVSARALDDAKAELDSAEADLRMAHTRRSLLGQSIGSTHAPQRIWIKASVYTGDLVRLNLNAPASVSALGARGTWVAVRPVSAPMTANPQAATASIFYEVDNASGAFRMGERVNVAVPTTDQIEALTVPWSAVLYDIHGGEWVYARLGAHVFARKRVQVRTVVGPIAALALAPAAGTEVVTTGAAELFGTEFGVAH